MPPSRTKFIILVRAVAIFTLVTADFEANKVLRRPGRKPSDPADNEEENSMIVRLTLSSVTMVWNLASFFGGAAKLVGVKRPVELIDVTLMKTSSIGKL